MWKCGELKDWKKRKLRETKQICPSREPVSFHEIYELLNNNRTLLNHVCECVEPMTYPGLLHRVLNSLLLAKPPG